MIGDLVRRLVAAGATPEVIAIAVEAVEAAQAKLKERRARDADRKRRVRGLSADGHGTFRAASADIPPDGPPSVPPDPLQHPPLNPPACSPPSFHSVVEQAVGSPQNSQNGHDETPPEAEKPARKRKAERGRIEYPGEFELLWSEYPRARNASKTEAFRAWSRLDEQDRKDCFQGAIEYGAWLSEEALKRKGGDPPPVKHLVTFINQRQWETLLEYVKEGNGLVYGTASPH